MTVPQIKPVVLRDLLNADTALRIDLPDDTSPALPGLDRDDLIQLAGRTVLIATRSQASTAAALIALDGVASAFVICPPDMSSDLLRSIAETAGVEAIITDHSDFDIGMNIPVLVRGTNNGIPDAKGLQQQETRWIMPTSGTTGRPKLVAHRFSALIGAISSTSASTNPVWATFYDIRRYGGLQIFLRACAAGARLVLTNPTEQLGDFIGRCTAAGVTHLTGTPSHWRRLLMSPFASQIDPAYVRLSGEIADRAILDALRAKWPSAAIIHAYASTEAGVGFEVSDGQEGFPAAYLGGLPGIYLKIEADTLRIRSSRTALTYVGPDAPVLLDDDGFVDTDDVVERVGDRCYFRGRRSGVVNVGGNKVHPEEVERVINLHPSVSMSRVRSRRNPILGDLIVADVVLKPSASAASELDHTKLKDEILSACRRDLARHKVPVALEFSASLPLIGSGKMGRQHA